MSLEFDKVVPQVEKMARAIAHRTEDVSQRGLLALDLFAEEAGDLAEVNRKIELVRERDAGYRGAAPFQELVNATFDAPECPSRATLVAADGSQIYPDPHSNALYYLTNIGTFVYHHGVDILPEQFSQPYLYYADSDLRDRNGHGSVIKNTAVNARRTVQEIQTLTQECWNRQNIDAPIVGVLDGPLLWMITPDIPDGARLEATYRDMLVQFYELHNMMQAGYGCNATLIGYTDRHDSRFVVRLLYLLSLEDDEVRRSVLDTDGPFEGLTDNWLFSKVLQPGQRSSIMIQQSPRNKSYKFDTGEPYEITFFYLNVGTAFEPHIVRVELPMWAARLPGAVDEVHALMLEQCTFASRYPYILTRADELAVVRNHERHELQTLINIELLRQRQAVDTSPKQQGKSQTRAERRRYGQTT